MKNLTIIFFIVLTLNSISQDFNSDFNNSDLIFKGKLIQKKEFSKDNYLYSFSIVKKWKNCNNDAKDTIDINAISDKNLEIDSLYIVFAKDFNMLSFFSKSHNFYKTFENCLNIYYSENDCFNNIERELTSCESDYLNQITRYTDEKWFRNVDFSRKKVLFTDDFNIIPKSIWFEKFSFTISDMQLIKLNEEEKKIYNYDYIFVTHMKMLVSKNIKKKILKQLSAN